MIARADLARRMFRAVAIAIAVTSVTVIPLTACNLKTATLLLEDFDSANVLGLHFWKLDPDSGTYRQSIRIEFGETAIHDDSETIRYSVWKGGEKVAGGIPSLVERDSVEPDRVVIRPILPWLEPGVYRLSSYNGVGNSRFSADTLER